jgi:hypothetical protein
MPDPSFAIASRSLPKLDDDVVVLFANGDPDDHYRLCVLLAEALRTRAPEVLSDSVASCLDRSVSWRTRLDAFRDLMEQGLREANLRACLYDVDALDPGTNEIEALWDDQDFIRQRGEFLDAVLTSVNAGGWILVRPKPSPRVSERLQVPSRDDDFKPANVDSEAGSLADLVSPEALPLLNWIIQANILSVREAGRLAEAVGPAEFAIELLDVAYEALPASTRRAGRMLSTLRSPQHVNGALGPFPLAPNAEHGLLRADVDRLREAGLIQEFTPTTARVARGARQALAARAETGMREEWRALHRWIASASHGATVTDELECHHHAVAGGDVQRALATSRFYVADLRDLATRLSREESRFPDAAELYRLIVDSDDTDAYAWEYLGYNIARHHGRREPTEPERREVLNAYQKACDLDRHNPLYQGRLLGYRARLGQDVEREINRSMERFARDFPGTSAVSFFAKPVLEGMGAGNWGTKRFDVFRRWLPLLRRFDPVRSLLPSDYE